MLVAQNTLFCKEKGQSYMVMKCKYASQRLLKFSSLHVVFTVFDIVGWATGWYRPAKNSSDYPQSASFEIQSNLE